ncbi:hypothetical protein AAFF_G00263400 [Aldrovandia affinis]|uniref:Reverse transcriptase/retrotransposon-derived protein RNase H-like domain-containing protein n=1 Tax=Aldrovandia affinis TaxID=143900 RepID=A0AAD7STX7_9TELE|nr:hypothetical protein AAFF_G00263400 [Aldrovandia affinis]
MPLPARHTSVYAPTGSPLAKRQAAEEQIWEMVAAGVIEPSDSPWAAPAVLVKKKDDSWLSAGGVSTDLSKIAAVHDWPIPTNVSDLRSFLGLASYYHRYVQDFTTIASPLHRSIDRGQPYVLDDPCSTAFKTLQTALITAPVLAYPDVNHPFIIDTDASNVGIGAVLSQQGDSGEQEARPQLAPSGGRRGSRLATTHTTPSPGRAGAGHDPRPCAELASGRKMTRMGRRCRPQR